MKIKKKYDKQMKYKERLFLKKITDLTILQSLFKELN